jgi:hypothetical protein
VVKVLRPFRSVIENKKSQPAYLSSLLRQTAGLYARLCTNTNGKLTLNTNVYVILRLLGLSCIFVGFGEGVCDLVSCCTTRIAIRPGKGMAERQPRQCGDIKVAIHITIAFIMSRIHHRDSRGCTQMADSPKVLRFSIDINSSVPGSLGGWVCVGGVKKECENGVARVM